MVCDLLKLSFFGLFPSPDFQCTALKDDRQSPKKDILEHVDECIMVCKHYKYEIERPQDVVNCTVCCTVVNPSMFTVNSSGSSRITVTHTTQWMSYCKVNSYIALILLLHVYMAVKSSSFWRFRSCGMWFSVVKVKALGLFKTQWCAHLTVQF